MVLSVRPLDDVSAVTSFELKLRIRESPTGSLLDLKSDGYCHDIGYVRNEDREVRFHV